ncbi:uncharacterized protein FIBRA_07582 [Fibroporia radiculosa]|uniref:Cytochrome P450 n=1 Tax=Fibroporia radiculosa TaxID=599839 RepID=J4I0X9_9APHY|nr:uncharacterized protein FIBRA_07582 [Fibroporia radiculosa]CCM05367.1 predicted protein [Fibroporia radiculosa]
MVSLSLSTSMFAWCALGTSVLLYAAWKAAALVAHARTSPLRHIPGPRSVSWLYGNLTQIARGDPTVLREDWVDAHGPTIKYKGLFNRDIVYTVDPRALNHILSHSTDYPKPELVRFSLSQFLGEGLLFVENDQHRQQRRIMNPAFGPAQIRELAEIFFEKAIQLRDAWSHEIAKHSEPAKIEVLGWLTKTTLDVIGLAGFDYDFDTLNINGKPNELYQAFQVIFGKAALRPSVIPMLKYLFPPLRVIPDIGQRRIARARAVMDRIALKLVREKKADIASAAGADKAGTKPARLQSRDLLTLLLKANVGADIPESQRLSDSDVIAQIPTFLVAGHETTSNATSWGLYALALAPAVQSKLREELWAVPTDSPSMDELQALPLLDAVVRETLRLHAPVPFTVRVAVRDDVIPLGTPYTDLRGQVHDSIRPERWDAMPEAAQSIPGVWGNMMTFLGGPRSCIGFRFTLIEMKAIMFTLLRAFEFELALPADEIVRQTADIQRPIVKSEADKGGQLPMLVRPHVRV